SQASKRHASVGVSWRVEINQAYFPHLVAVGREWRLADDEEELIAETAKGVVSLCVEPLSQCDRLIEHRLRRNTPTVVVDLHFKAVPPATFPQSFEIVRSQLFPLGGIRQAQTIVEKRSLQLNEARKPSQQGSSVVILERCSHGH